MSAGVERGFRPEIEGLRAVAVLPILFFHLDERVCPGGYIGVDIFFVISGFLITGMILSQADTFSFKTFYVRRIYRLLPALTVTLIATLIAGYSILGPGEYTALAKSSLFAFFGLSNVYFWGAVDYFNADSYGHPLLHTWSLGLEEQFYLIWPAVLILAVRYARRLLWPFIIAAGLGSFLAVLLVHEDAPHGVFYLMPFRIFEFACGACLCAVMPSGKTISAGLRAMLAFVAMCVLLACFLMLDNGTPWPSAWSILPCLATAMLILAGDAGPVGVLLKSKIARFLGRISYSLYMVHWPLITLYRADTITEPAPLDNVVLGLVSIVLAAILYATVESAFRLSNRAPSAGASRLFPEFLSKLSASTFVRPAMTAALFAIGVASAAVIWVQKGFPSRLDKTRIQFLDKGLTFAGDKCSHKRSRCIFGDANAARVVFVIGDSHALNLIYGLDELFKKHALKGIALYDHGCVHLYGTKRFIKGVGDKKCARNIAYAYGYVAGRHEPVILANSLAGAQNEIGLARDKTPLKLGEDAHDAWMADRLAESLAFLRADKRPVILFNQMYSTGVHLPNCLARPAARIDSKMVETQCAPWSLEKVRSKYQRVDDMVAAASVKFRKATVVDPKDAFCTPAGCTVKTEREGLFFRDQSHLTNAGSEFLINHVKSRLLPVILPRKSHD